MKEHRVVRGTGRTFDTDVFDSRCVPAFDELDERRSDREGSEDSGDEETHDDGQRSNNGVCVWMLGCE